MRIYTCRDSEEYMEATKVLLEVEADVKEKFATSTKTGDRDMIYDDPYGGASQLEKMNMKFARDQLRKAIVSMSGERIDAALEDCHLIPGFGDNETNQILLKWADKVRQEAFDTIDTSTWAQEEREKYANFVLRKAYESRNIKHLKAAIRDAERLENESLRIYVCRWSQSLSWFFYSQT